MTGTDAPPPTKRKEVRLSEPFTVSFPPGSLGIGLQSTDHLALEVSKVAAASVAKKGGVVVGDHLLSVNDKDCTNISVTAALKLVKNSPRPIVIKFAHVVTGTDAPPPQQPEPKPAETKEKPKAAPQGKTKAAPKEATAKKKGSNRFMVEFPDGSLGFNLRKSSDQSVKQLEVSKIVPGSAASEHRLAVGDRLVRINDKDSTDDMAPRHILMLLKKTPRPIKLWFERSEQPGKKDAETRPSEATSDEKRARAKKDTAKNKGEDGVSPMFEVTIGKGNLGLKLGKNKNPKDSGVLVITEISPSGLIAQNNPGIAVGFILAFVNIVDCRKLPPTQIMKTLKSAKRPMTLKFMKPSL